MTEYRALREVEAWSPANIFWALVLAAVVIVVIVWLIRRYLAD